MGRHGNVVILLGAAALGALGYFLWKRARPTVVEEAAGYTPLPYQPPPGGGGEGYHTLPIYRRYFRTHPNIMVTAHWPKCQIPWGAMPRLEGAVQRALVGRDPNSTIVLVVETEPGFTWPAGWERFVRLSAHIVPLWEMAVPVRLVEDMASLPGVRWVRFPHEPAPAHL